MLGVAACELEPGPAPAPPRPSIEVAEQPICSGLKLPLTRIDAIVPAPDGRLAVVGARFDQSDPGVFIYGPDALIIAVLDPRAGLEVTQVFERPGDADPFTPVAWDGDRLLVTHDRRRLAPPDDPDGPGFDVPHGTLGWLDPRTPTARIDGERVFMVLGEPAPTSPVLRQFVVAERGGEGEASSRVVASYGNLRAEAVPPFEGEIEDVSVSGWHIEPDGRLVVRGEVQVYVGRWFFFHIGYPTPVDADPEAGWFPPEALESDATRTFVNRNPNDPWRIRWFEGLLPGEDGRARTILYDEEKPATHIFAFPDGPEPMLEYTLGPPPLTANDVRMRDFVHVDGDLIAAGSVCLVWPDDSASEYHPDLRECQPFVARYTTSGARRIQWLTKAAHDALEQALAIRRVGDALVVFVASPWEGFLNRNSFIPAEVIRVGLDGRCLGP